VNVGSLFAGIGGFDLGLERAGMRTVWFCEQDEYCQRVLARHWPGVPCYSDVRSLVADPPSQRDAAVAGELPEKGTVSGSADGGRGGRVPVPVSPIDVLVGGFPCQDISVAGKGAGLDGARSGLWSEYARLIGELRPSYVIVENVTALLGRGVGRVLGDLAALGYDAEWDCIPAAAVGAPHRRDRIWIVAYPAGVGSRDTQHAGTGSTEVAAAGVCSALPREVADARCIAGEADGWWAVEPNVGRVAHGVPARVDRLRSLGNALVPQIAEWIGHRIREHEEGGVKA